MNPIEEAVDPPGHILGGPALMRGVNRWLARIGVPSATLAITAAVTVVVVALDYVIATLQGREVQTVTAVSITVLLGIPIVYYTQTLIHRLLASRRSLKLLTAELAVARDQALAGDRAKAAFLANMSHELRTPLNAIIGFSEMMTHEAFGALGNKRYCEYVQDIHQSGTHLLGVINDVLDLAKIQAGGFVIEDAQACNLLETLDQVVRMLAPVAEKSDHSIETALPEEMPALVFSARMLRQILLNLIGNALKFTPSGGVVRVAGGFITSGAFQLAVSDNGLGMTPDEVTTALTPFGQVRSAFDRKHSGTGLGLPLAKAMMELHGGGLTVRSRPGVGTTVVLTFPQRAWTAAKAQPTPGSF